MNVPQSPEAPRARQIPKILSTHGDERADPYYWLRERENPEVLKHLQAENEYTEAVLKPTAELQRTLFQEITGRIKQEDASVPFFKRGFFYQKRYEEGKEHPIYARRNGSLEAPEEVLLDVNILAQPYAYYQVGGWSVSPNNGLLAYGEDTVSRRMYTLRFKNLETGALYPDKIENTTGNAVWAADNHTVFYTKRDPDTLRAHKVLRHRLGTDPSEDVEVFCEEDDTYYCSVSKTKSEAFIVIGSETTLAEERWYLSAEQPEGEFQVFQPRDYAGKLEYDIDHMDDKWYIRTNLEAENFRLMQTSLGRTQKENWEEVIPHREGVFLEEVELFRDFLVLNERREGITELRIRSWDGKEDHDVRFPEEAHLAYPGINPQFDTEWLRLGYQSMKTPPSVFDYNMKTRQLVLKKEQEILGGFKKENYASERVFATARDGARVPISLVYRKDLFQRNGQSSLLLYGYGSYGLSMDPYFSFSRLSLLDRGFVYAIAHIRGGQEMGRKWYEEGKLLKKKNTFYDFIDCGEYLVQEKYANPHLLFAFGGSAGGLLMGAVMNLRPDLWKGLVAAVPFVDVVTTMLDDSIPLTTFEYDEWGNPNQPEYYQYMKSYSPYDNIEEKDYPHLLVTTGLHDSQVQYWEPAKWVARLRERKTDNNLLLLYTDMDTGHGGKSGRFEQHRETARIYAFFIWLAEESGRSGSGSEK